MMLPAESCQFVPGDFNIGFPVTGRGCKNSFICQTPELNKDGTLPVGLIIYQTVPFPPLYYSSSCEQFKLTLRGPETCSRLSDYTPQIKLLVGMRVEQCKYQPSRFAEERYSKRANFIMCNYNYYNCNIKCYISATCTDSMLRL